VPLILSKRGAAVTERMDAPDCDDELLHNTYVQFRTINILLSGWRLIYLLHLKPRMTDTSAGYTLLDIGFGGGDIPYYLVRWAEKDGINLHVTGIEKDPRACAFAKGYYRHRNVRYRCTALSNMVAQGLCFDFVISNNTVHHLSESELQRMMADTAKICTRYALFNDIERGDFAYGAFAILSWLFYHNSYICHDGKLSVQRSYTKKELCAITPKGWVVKRLLPYRLLLIHEP
jgi:2-polyprenyl-3-methyl-5-hydroxy-6-metoxy-1,4-benzoquinol methylase